MNLKLKHRRDAMGSADERELRLIGGGEPGVWSACNYRYLWTANRAGDPLDTIAVEIWGTHGVKRQ